MDIGIQGLAGIPSKVVEGSVRTANRIDMREGNHPATNTRLTDD